MNMEQKHFFSCLLGPAKLTFDRSYTVLYWLQDVWVQPGQPGVPGPQLRAGEGPARHPLLTPRQYQERLRLQGPGK
jgi:hypothetical protein